MGLISHHIEISDLVCSLSQLTGFDKIPAFAFNPFLAYVPILYPLKTQKNQRFFGVFSGYKMEILAKYGLIEDTETYLGPCGISTVELFYEN